MKGIITHRKVARLIKQAGGEQYNIAVLRWGKLDRQSLYIVQGTAVLQFPITMDQLMYCRLRGILIINCDKKQK